MSYREPSRFKIQETSRLVTQEMKMLDRTQLLSFHSYQFGLSPSKFVKKVIQFRGKWGAPPFGGHRPSQYQKNALHLLKSLTAPR